jgi:DNA replication protein
MLIAAGRFIEGLTRDIPTERRWLSFLGPSGVGKTYLAKNLISIARALPHLSTHKSLINPIGMWQWGTLMGCLKDKQYWLLDDIRDSNLVLIDDIGIEEDRSGYGREQLYRILNSRVGKWTVITCNMDLAEIAERIDTRIASRLIRDRNEVLEIKTLDYCMRSNAFAS